jgi:phage minor structural protein
MSDLLIYDPSDNLLAILSNNSSDTCRFWDAPFKEELNRGSSFEFSVDAEHEDAQYITAENQVAFMDKDGNFRLFVIKETEDEGNENEAVTRAFCEPSMFELNDEPIEDVRPYNTTAEDALTRALVGTRWQVGTVASLGLNSTNFYYTYVSTAIEEIINTWGGELQDRVEIDSDGNIIGKYIDILPRRGQDTGKRWEIDKDLLSMKRIKKSYPKTALYGRGKSIETETGGFTRKTTFKDIVWSVASGDPADKPAGQEWVGDEDALALYGRKNSDDSLRHRFGFYEDYDIEDPTALLFATWSALQEQKRQFTNFEMDVFTLEDITGYEHEKVRLGDTTFAIDRRFKNPIEAEERVILFEYDVSSPEDTGKVALGQFIDLFSADQRLDDIEARVGEGSGIWDQVGGETGPIDEDDFRDIVPPKPIVTATGLFSKVLLEWERDYSAYMKHYEVYVSTVPGFTPDVSNLYAKELTSIITYEGEVNQQYYFKVRGVNRRDNPGPFSDEVSATTVRIRTFEMVVGSVTSSIIADLAVTAAELADQAVQEAKLGTGAVTSTKIANLAVGNAAIQNGAITNAKIGFAEIAEANIQDAAISRAKIQNAAIDNAKIADATITSAKIANIAAEKIVTGTLTAMTIVGSSLTSSAGLYSSKVQIYDGKIEFDHPSYTTDIVPFIRMKDSGYYTGPILVNRGNGNISLSAPRKGGGSYGEVYLGYVDSFTANTVVVWGQLNAAAGLSVSAAGISNNGTLTNAGKIFAQAGIQMQGGDFNAYGYSVFTDRSFRATSSVGEMESFIFKANSFTSYFQALSDNGVRCQNILRSAYVPCYALSYPGASKREWKTNIRDYEGSALEEVSKMRVRNYQFKSDYNEEVDGVLIRVKDESEVITRTGLILDEAPESVIEGEGIETYSLSAINTRAIQELLERVENLERKIS